MGLFAVSSFAGDGAVFSVGTDAAGFKVNSDGTAEISGSVAVTVAALTLTDTNVTTTVTAYTPAFKGQVLIGGMGTGTNAVWIAKGASTNDWVQVAP